MACCDHRSFILMAGKTLRMAGWCAFSKATLKNQKPFAVTLIEPFPLQFGHFTNAEMPDPSQ